jgi:hypothetical protein
VPAVEWLELAEDQVEFFCVPLVVQSGVLEKRKRGAIGRGELAEEEVASVEESFKQVEGGGQLATQRSDSLLIGSLLAPLGLDLIRRALPDAIEPVEKDVQLSPASLFPGEQRRVGRAGLEIAEDLGRVKDHFPVLDEHGHQRLAADALDLTAIGGIDIDPIDLDPLWPAASATRSTLVENGIR